MAQYRVVVTDRVFPDTDREQKLLADIDAELVVAEGDREQRLSIAAGADALLNTYMPLDADALSRLEQCKVVARYGIGVDNIDLRTAREAGIAVTNVPDYSVEEVAAHSLALMLAVHRRLLRADHLTRAGAWGVEQLVPIRRISELVVGLVGYGRIARRFAASLHTLGAMVITFDPYVNSAFGDGTELVGFDDLLARADVVSVHCPLTPETRGMIALPQLLRMKDDAVLINTSRGPLVVLADLLQALRDGAIGGAALDVFEEEPPDVGAFEGVPNLLVTPHIAYYSEAAIAESQTKAATQVRKALLGEPLDYLVN